jgi:DMSO/TMAO reductase YedYZ heme-binding membrane subunit
MTTQLWWYVARAGGLVSWALLAATVLWGLSLSSKVFGRRPRPAWLLDLHRYLGGLAVVFVGVHVAAIMLDTYVPFGPVEVLVPFASSWHPGAVAWGIVAVYLLVAVEVTSLLRRKLSMKVWRRTHYLSFPLFVVATIHGLAAGTDSGTAAMQISVVAVCAAVVALAFFRAKPSPREARPAGRQPAPRPRPSNGAAPRPAASPRPQPAPTRPGPRREPVSVTLRDPQPVGRRVPVGAAPPARSH